MPDKKIVDESFHIPSKRGNGQLRREVWVDETGKVTKYNLAYINHALHSGDNGRVIGYDNNHNYHHKHIYGQTEAVEFINFEDIEAQFERDWAALKESR